MPNQTLRDPVQPGLPGKLISSCAPEAHPFRKIKKLELSGPSFPEILTKHPTTISCLLPSPWPNALWRQLRF